MARVAPDGTWLDVNQKVCDIVGYTKQELLARTFQDITYPADLNTDLAFVRQMLAGELQTYCMDKRYVRKNGALIWIRLTVSLVREPSGVPKYFISVIEDIDQRKSIQSALYENERRFSTLVNNLPALVYRCRNDPQWTAEYVSEGVFALTGYKAEDFTINRKISFGELIHPDDRERVWGDIRQGIDAHCPYRTTYRVITAQGQHRWMWEQGAGTFDATGNLLTLDGVVLDITERQRAEEALQESERRFRTVLETLQLIAVMLDRAGNIILCNDYLLNLTGWKREEALHRNWFDMFIPPDIGGKLKVDIFLESVRTGNIPAHYENEIITRSGERRLIAWNNTVFRGLDGNVESTASIGEDITKRRQAETVLRESEHKLRLVIDGLGPSLFVGLLTPDGVLVEANRPALAAAGLKPEDVLGKPFEETYWWAYSKSVQEQLRHAITRAQRGESSQYDVPVRVAEGATIWIDFSLHPALDAQGRVCFIVSSASVIDERKRAEQQLKESTARYRAIFEGAGASLWEEDFSVIHADVMSLSSQHRAGLRAWFDAHPSDMHAFVQRLRVVDVNSATLKLFGAKSKEELLSGIAQIFVPESLPVFRDELLALVGGATSFNAEVEVGTLSNERRTVLLSLTVVPSERPWARILVSLLDISEMKTYRDRLELHVAQRTAQLQTTNKELESFCYSVSHDLRTPLRGIHGFTQVLLEDYGDKFDQTARGYLDRVQRAAVGMGELIDALLGLSRVTRGEIKRVPIDLSSLAHQVMETLQQSEPQRFVDTTISPNITAIGDPTLLRAVLENLLGNAWKYTSKTERARIEFSMEMRDATSVFCIADNGAGFDMKYATRLFGAFRRLHSDAEFPGTGVGLATVERVVHRHGGRVWAEASIGKGAQFYFTLQP